MNKNKKIISASLALALGVSLLIPNAKANEEKTVEKALKEPVKTSEKVKIEEKSDVINEKITINKATVNEGEEKPEVDTEKPADGTENQEGDTEKTANGTENQEGDTEKPEVDKEEQKEETEKPEDKTGNPKINEEKPEDKTENPKTNEEKPKDEKKVKPKEFKMSEIFNENTFEFIKNDAIKTLTEYPDIYTKEEMEEFNRKANLVREAKSIDEILKITGWEKEILAKGYLLKKGIINYDEYNSDLIKIIDDTMTSNQKNPNRKNKKIGTTTKVSKTNKVNTTNTANKVSKAGENVQTGVGSLSAILGLLGASSLGLFKSKRK